MTLDGNSGADNTAVGTNAMRNSGATSYTTAIGENAGTGVNSGTGNTYLGYNANVTSNSSISNATAIGSGAIVTTSNIIQLGADGTNGTTAVSNVNTSGFYTGSGFKTPTGTGNQFLKADGTVDSSTYLTAAGTATNVSGVVAVANGGTGLTAVGTNGQVLTTNNSGALVWTTLSTTVTEVADEYTSTTGVGSEYLTTGKTSFTLTQAPSANSKVKMYVNGIRISNTAYTLSGSTLTYVPSNNGGNNLLITDRVQFDYFY